LKGFTTTEKDKKRGVDRFPPIEFRNRDTDLLKEDVAAQMNQMGLGATLDFDNGKALRDQQYAATKDY